MADFYSLFLHFSIIIIGRAKALVCPTNIIIGIGPVPYRPNSDLRLCIQGFEVEAFDRATSGRFFTTNYVPMIFLEWDFAKSKSGRQPKGILRLVGYMTSLGYTAFTGSGQRLSVAQWLRYAGNEVFLMKDGRSKFPA